MTSALSKVCVFCLWIFCIGLAGLVIVIPVTFDTLHVTDTTFIAQIAAWVMDGAVPGRDFGHFYGGAYEQTIAWAYALFGMHIKALDYALVLQLVVALIGLILIGWFRLTPVILALFGVLLTITVLTRHPFEEYALVERVTAAHSFGYNRFGTALSVLAVVAVLVPAKTPSAGLIGAAVAGFCITCAVLTKSTFFPVLIGCALGLLILARGKEAGVLVVVALVSAAILDPSTGRILGTLLYASESSEMGGGLIGLVRKAVSLFGSQQFAVLAGCIVIAILLANRGRDALRLVGAMVVILGSFWASTVTMGTAGLASQQSLPMISAVILAAWAATPADMRYSAQISSLAVLVWCSLVVPHTINMGLAAAKAMRNAPNVAFSEGPLRGYLAQSRGFRDAQGRDLSYVTDPDFVVAETERRLINGKRSSDTDYIRLAEAVRLVNAFPELEGHPLVSDSRLGLGFALGLPRVEGFPAWLRTGSPELAEMPLENVDVVLLDALGQSPYQDRLEPFLATGFLLCQTSPLWDLYTRVDVVPEGCEEQ